MKSARLLIIFLIIILLHLHPVESFHSPSIQDIQQYSEIPIQIDTFPDEETISSPDGRIVIGFRFDNTKPVYRVLVNGDTFIDSSQLGFIIQNSENFLQDFQFLNKTSRSVNQSWNPVWGQHSTILNNFNEMELELFQESSNPRTLQVYFRAYNDGIAFRYEFPDQPHLNQFNITSEETRFNFVEDATCWWIPDDYDSYEHLYTESSLSYALSQGVNTPMTCKNSNGLHFSMHEAALTNYSGMTLTNVDDSEPLSAKSQLVPYYDSEVKVIASTPFKTPWRTVQISEGASGLLESNLILNLNEPSRIEDTSWIKPMTYMGVWWALHLNLWTWTEGFMHGATTDNVEDYIDTCAELNCGGVLVEGWNTGWNVWSQQNLTEPTPDYDIDAVVSYAASKDIGIIGHLETGGNLTNYLSQGIDNIFDYYVSKGISAVKTGYAVTMPGNRIITPDLGQQHHHGQYMVNHYRNVVLSAAEHGIMINVHEPIKPTGIERTYPNMMTREGVRGTEYNAWGNPGNNPTHTTLLPFTRLLAGPADYTPGIFNFDFAAKNRHSTLAHQLALYITLHSPFQMMADIAQSYHVDRNLANELRIETSLLRNIPTTWDETIGLDSSVDEYVGIARRAGTNWFVGVTNNDEVRDYGLDLAFLNPDEKYYAIIYQDRGDADFEVNPDAVEIVVMNVTSSDGIGLGLQRGGGAAIHIVPVDEADQSFIYQFTVSSTTNTTDDKAGLPDLIIVIPLLTVIVYRKRKNIHNNQ